MKRKSLLIISVLIISLIFASCAKNEQSADSMEAPMAAMDMDDGGIYYGEAEEYREDSNSSAENVIDYSEKIIYNVSMGIVVDNPVDISKEIKEQVSIMGGYVSSSYTYKNDDSADYVRMQIRVPASGLNNMTEYLYSISEVEYENMYTDNITESYYDTVTRLEHEKLQAEQLEELMSKAETIEDILTVRQELSRVQETIEVYEGRIRMWDSLVDYSTIDLSIQPTPSIDNNSGVIRLITLGETGRAIVRALDNSWRFVANFFSVLLRIIAALIIPAIIVVPIVIFSVRAAKKNKAKKENKD